MPLYFFQDNSRADKFTNSSKSTADGCKSNVPGNDRKSILSACEFGEDAAQKAYKMALEDDELPTELKSLVKIQQSQLKLAHDTIKSLRDRAN